jgi:hypothetical protein
MVNPQSGIYSDPKFPKKFLMWSMLVAIEDGIDFQDSRDCLRQMSSVADAEPH